MPGAGLEPAREHVPLDFKSNASAGFATQATLPTSSHGFLRLDGPALLSAYYVDCANEGNEVYVRLYESEGQGGEVTLTLDWSPSSAQAVDLLGQPLDVPVRANGQRVHVALKSWQIVTLRLGTR